MGFKEKVFNILNTEIGNKHNLLDLSISLKEAGLLLKSNINTAETINLLSKTSPNKNLKKIFSEVYENLLQGHDLYNSFLKVNKFDNLFLNHSIPLHSLVFQLNFHCFLLLQACL